LWLQKCKNISESWQKEATFSFAEAPCVGLSNAVAKVALFPQGFSKGLVGNPFARRFFISFFLSLENVAPGYGHSVCSKASGSPDGASPSFAHLFYCFMPPHYWRNYIFNKCFQISNI